jgi:DUF4097 and DUF4098 domain-containing protein YvlB
MPQKLLLVALIAGVPALALAATPIERSVAVEPTARVEVANVRGSVVITGWDQPQVAIGGSLGEGSELKVEGEGARVSIRIETPDGKGWGWWGRGGPAADTRREIKVPRGVALEVDAVSADVRVDGISGSREVSLESVSGDVRLQAEVERLQLSSVSGDIEMGGSAQRAELESVSGNLVAGGLAGEITVETVSGDARIAAGEVDRLSASTVSGSIEIDLAPRGAATIRAETLSGELRLQVPADLSAKIEASTFSGSIRSDFGTVDKPEHGPGESLRATAGAGAARIEVETFSGDLEIRKR